MSYTHLHTLFNNAITALLAPSCRLTACLCKMTTAWTRLPYFSFELGQTVKVESNILPVVHYIV